VKIDVLLDPFGARWEDVLDAARAAEGGGFDGVWTWDHMSGAVHRAPHVLECWTLLTAIAASTERVMIGPLVLNPANRDAGTLAAMAATLQHISGGRLLLGVGAGGGANTPYAEEQYALGRDAPPDPVRREATMRTIATLHDTWQQPGFLVPQPRPPIIVGGFGPKMATLAGRHADGFNAPYGRGFDRLAGIVRRHNPHAIITASATLDRRAELGDHGVDRMIVYVAPPYRAVRSGTPLA
jgi:alkanesulfonate monooxygenase SsuD/methylene tetrahydromethanopterin reductase-like flavin-dependent oxidoreductase (luciferase family)